MSTWTAWHHGETAGGVEYDVTDKADRWVGRIIVPSTDEGRRTVARMVAAPDALKLLADVLRVLESGGDFQLGPKGAHRDLPANIRAALEAAKSLPETP